MTKILAAIVLFLAPLTGAVAEEALAEPTVDVSKPSFISIMLRRPQIFDDLPKNREYTIFAPTDEAFNNLDPAIRDRIFEPEFGEQLDKLMHNHIIFGKYNIEDLKDGMVIESVGGKNLLITHENGKVMINGAAIVVPDGITDKGVLHEIDKVLVPQDLDLKTLIVP